MPARSDLPAIFRAPDDPDARIWRYLDFPAYVWMLDRQRLFFPRADLLGDPFEGSASPVTRRLLAEQFTAATGVTASPDRYAALSYIGEWQRPWTYVSCWHVNTSESAAMWSLYGVAQRSIVVRSTHGRLVRCAPTEAYVGLVQYIDYDVTPIPPNNLLWPYIHKRLSFAHEHELRAVLPEYATDGQSNLGKPNPSDGFEAPVELDELVDAVFVAPGARKWFKDLVADVTKRYGLTGVVERSALDARPIY